MHNSDPFVHVSSSLDALQFIDVHVICKLFLSMSQKE